MVYRVRVYYNVGVNFFKYNINISNIPNLCNVLFNIIVILFYIDV